MISITCSIGSAQSCVPARQISQTARNARSALSDIVAGRSFRGRALVASGRVTRDNDQPVIFNPRYELRPAGSE